MKKRFLAVFMSLCMMFGAVPFTAFAEDGTGEEAVCSCEEPCTEDKVNDDCDICAGDYTKCDGKIEDLKVNKKSENKTNEAKNKSPRNNESEISDADSLIALLNSSKSKNEGKNYTIENDITISGSDYSSYTNREFAGTIDGKNHTITIEGEAGPLFDILRGSVSNLNVEFKDDVNGTPFAVDILNEDSSELLLENITVEVNGDILPAEHNFREHKASIIDGPGGYGNWYIHYGGQPVWLATGFAWYLWGAEVEDVSITVHGNIGTDEEKLQDTTSAGFAYFAVNGDKTDKVKYEKIDITVDGNIQSYTGKPDDDSPAYASAYGFATGTDTGVGSGFGTSEMAEFCNVEVNAENIIAVSKQGSSSAMGMARYVQGYTHDCTVNVKGRIYAENEEGSKDTDEYGYSNGDAYAYGFMLNTGDCSIENRKNFENNNVNAGSIEAVTNSEVYAGGAWTSGFAHQMMSSSFSPDGLSYNNNTVDVENDLSAKANKGDAVVAGFVTSTGNDGRNKDDHIYENNVSVGGDIKAESNNYAFASGYAYQSKTHRRNCTVYVNGSIIASSPEQAMAAGFTNVQYTGNGYYIKDCSVTVEGDIKTEISGDAGGMAVGLVNMFMAGSDANNFQISGNEVTVNGEIFCEGGDSSNHFSGLLGGVLGSSGKNVSLTFKENQFIGNETLVDIADADKETYPGLYTNLTISFDPAIISDASGNTIKFTDENGREYTSDVEYIESSYASSYFSLWQLTKIEEIIKEYTITASAGKNGSISPEGEQMVKKGEDITFTITPDSGYKISDVIVDGESIGAEESYTFKNVKEAHTIEAVFEKKSDGGSSSGGSSYSLSSEAYYVRYHDGDDLVKDGKYGKGERVTVKGDVFDAPLGKALAGWSTEEDGKVEYVPGDTFRMPDKSVNLYAVWEDETQIHNAYISGYPDGTVGPDKIITRAEAAVMLYNLLDEKSGYINTFTDVPENQWYSEAVITLAGMGVVNGYLDGTFRPDAPITRAEFVTMAVNFAKAGNGTYCSFADVSQDMWYYGAVAKASEKGWIGGYPDGTFGPERYITRAEVTVIINRMENREADMEFIAENMKDMNTFTDLPSSHWAYSSMMEAANGHKYVRGEGYAREIWTETNK